MRRVTRPHVIAWRTHLEQQGLAGASIRRKLSALASLFDHLCECNVAPPTTPSAASSARPSTPMRAKPRP